jgi:hypothetical protein
LFILANQIIDLERMDHARRLHDKSKSVIKRITGVQQPRQPD